MEIRRIRTEINTPPPWWRSCRCLCWLLLVMAVMAAGLFIALGLVLWLPKPGASAGAAAYKGPQFSEDPFLLSVTGRSINVQVKTSEAAAVYYCLVEARAGSGAAVMPSGAQVAGSSTPYAATSVSGAVACDRVLTQPSRPKALSISDLRSRQLPECAGRLRDCQRCPAIDPETRYRLYLAPGYPVDDWGPGGVGEPVALDVTTADITPPGCPPPRPAARHTPLHPPSCCCFQTEDHRQIAVGSGVLGERRRGSVWSRGWSSSWEGSRDGSAEAGRSGASRCGVCSPCVSGRCSGVELRLVRGKLLVVRRVERQQQLMAQRL